MVLSDKIQRVHDGITIKHKVGGLKSSDLSLDVEPKKIIPLLRRYSMIFGVAILFIDRVGRGVGEIVPHIRVYGSEYNVNAFREYLIPLKCEVAHIKRRVDNYKFTHKVSIKKLTERRIDAAIQKWLDIAKTVKLKSPSNIESYLENVVAAMKDKEAFDYKKYRNMDLSNLNLGAITTTSYHHRRILLWDKTYSLWEQKR